MPYGRRIALFGMLCAVLFVSPASAAATELDPGFGDGGKVTTPLESTAMSTSVVLQPDGKVVAAGTADNKGSAALVRYNPDGTPDQSFGTGGVAKKPAGHTGVWGMVLQPDGRFVAVGHARTGTAFGLVRFNADGSVDHTFDTEGSAGAPVGSPASAVAIALQPDGKFVVAGTADHPSRFVVARYQPDGTIDETFGASGVTKSLLGGSSWVNGLALQPDGKIVVVGSAEVGPGTQQQFAAARYNPDGTLDDTFGTDGTIVSPLGSAPSFEGRVVQVQPDGKLVIAGIRFSGLEIVRLNRNGAADHSFGVNGIAGTRIGGYSQASGLALQPDGKIVVNGLGDVDGQFRFVLARFNADGALDDTFGTYGVITTPPDTTGKTAEYGLFSPGGQTIRGLVVQPDGDIISAGYQYIDGTSTLTLFRYQAVGTAAPGPTTSTTGAPVDLSPGGQTGTTGDPESAPAPSGPDDFATSAPPVVAPAGHATLPTTGSRSARSLTFLGTALTVAGLALRFRAPARAGANRQHA